MYSIVLVLSYILSAQTHTNVSTITANTEGGDNITIAEAARIDGPAIFI